MKGQPISEEELDMVMDLIIMPKVKASFSFILCNTLNTFLYSLTRSHKFFSGAGLMLEATYRKELKAKFREMEKLDGYPGKAGILKILSKTV